MIEIIFLFRIFSWLSLLLCLPVQYIFEIIFAEEICWLSLWYWKPMSCTFTATWKCHELPSALIVLWELMLCNTKTSKMFVIPKINEMMSWVVTFAAVWSSSATSPSPRFSPVHYVKRGFFSSQLMCSWYDLMIYLWTIICWPYVDFQKHTIISYFS